MPAYDELLQAVARISDVGDRLSNGLRPNLDERWESDLSIVDDIKRGKWPVTEPSGEVQLLCNAVEMTSLVVKNALEDRDRFASEDFDRAFRHAVDHGDTAGLHRVLRGAIDDAVRLPSTGATLKGATEKLAVALKQRRKREIGKG